jgi:hypothetical protein
VVLPIPASPSPSRARGTCLGIGQECIDSIEFDGSADDSEAYPRPPVPERAVAGALNIDLQFAMSLLGGHRENIE